MKNKAGQKRLTSLLVGVIILGVLLLTALFLFTGEVRVGVEKDRLTIQGSYWPGKTVLYEDVKNVRLAAGFSAGRRTNGFGGGRLDEGHFQNDAFGDYILYAYSGCDSCVVLETSDGVVAVNAETPEATRALYSSIQVAVSDFQTKTAG
jgi:hypothetical protein